MYRILLTNDDGIHSDGLTKLEEALREVGDVYTVAPASEMSGASHSLTLARPLRIRRIDSRHWTVDGTPTDCVTLALHRILGGDERPHLCVSGINHGGNLGDDATYSGTVAGALEATILGVPGLAFSLVARENFDFAEAARFAVVAVRKVLAGGAADPAGPSNGGAAEGEAGDGSFADWMRRTGTFLNINIPPGALRGVRVTRQGIKNARPIISEHIDPRGKPYYWIGEEYFTSAREDGTDYYAVEQGFVSVTPMRSDMTNHGALVALEGWNSIGHDEILRGAGQDQPAGRA